MSDDPPSSNSRLEGALRNTLDRHGHGLHYAVLREIASWRGIEHYWDEEAVEYPATLNGTPTHIDFVLRSRDKAARLVCECKSANPALIDWCFVRTPRGQRAVRLEQVVRRRAGQGGTSVSFPANGVTKDSDRIYHLAIPVKGEQPGDKHGDGGRTAVDDAVDQVLRGASALLEFLADANRADLVGPGIERSCFVVPVVFTTANLWVSDVDLATSDLATGKLPRNVALTRVPRVWLVQNISPQLRHSLWVSGSAQDSSLGTYATENYSRAVAIVQTESEGMKRFLRADWWPRLG